MTISVMIPTRNRAEELRRTLSNLVLARPAPDEVLVCADGCTDNTVEVMREQFPWVTLLVNDVGQGSVPSRDMMMRLASGDWVLSLDDDSYPVEQDFFAQADRVCAQHPEAGVITFPELRDGEVFASRELKPDSPGRYVSTYPNCAGLTRRDLYLRLPGFAVHFFHAYEEPDYALQCYSAGYAVWFEPTLTVRHHMSPIERKPMRTHHLNARNELWSVWMRCPFPQLIAVSSYRVLRQAVYAFSEGIDWLIREPVWWWQALRGVGTCVVSRSPIPWNIYYRWMRMARSPIFRRAELEVGSDSRAIQ